MQYSCNETFVRMDSNTGRIFVDDMSVFDRERHDQIDFVVTATEMPRGMYQNVQPMTATARVLISLTDQNDEAPYFVMSGNQYSILENRGQGAEIVGPQIMVYDNDEYMNTQWEIKIEPVSGNCPVEAVPNTGFHGSLITLKATENLDYEELTSCSVNLKKRFYFYFLRKTFFVIKNHFCITIEIGHRHR